MVLVEELAEEEPTMPAAEETEKPSKTKLKSGFLEAAKEPLYPPEGSSEGKVAPETHKAHTEHKLNKELNQGMNRGAEDNNGYDRPAWYTKDWPKDCQYNSPGCALDELPTSAHESELHRQHARSSERWTEAMKPGVQALRLSFMQVKDEDLPEILERFRGDGQVTEIDLSHNHIKDAGVQAIVAALASGAGPNLKEIKLYSNDFGELGQSMLTQGLPVFRKKLTVHWKEPSWAHIVRNVENEKAKAVAAVAAEDSVFPNAADAAELD